MDHERALSDAVAAARDRLEGTLRSVPAAAAALEGRGPRGERLEAALRLALASDLGPDLRGLARSQAEELHRARWALALSARPIVYREARRLGGRGVVSPQDLVEEGWLGVFAAAVRFEGERGVPFRSYARFWVRAMMHRAVDRGAEVRVSTRTREKVRSLRRLLDGWEATRGPGNRLAEAARTLGTDPADASALLVRLSPVAIDEPAIQLADDAVPADEAAASNEARAALGRALLALDPMSRAVVVERFGLDDDEPRSVREVASDLRVTCSRVRTLEHHALARLRSSLTGADPRAVH